MKFLLAVYLIATAFAAEDILKGILRSPKKTLQLYNDFKAKESLQFGSSEDRMRFRIFRNNAEFVAEANSHDDSAVYALNFFSAMTTGEKQQYLGLNVTGHKANPKLIVPAGLQVPDEKLWVKEGAVTAVKSQASCGSCWTFAAVGGLETRYQQASGKLRNFAEQEYLDCVYEGTRDGCRGGWPYDCYKYSAKNGGRLASTANYEYAAYDGPCKGSSKPDAMVAYKITGFESIGSTEAANIAALASSSLSVAFEVTDFFQQYSKGIMRDAYCKAGRANHAVTAVGYTAQFVLVKNSWGSYWGDSGFVKFARNYHNCGLFEYSVYPTLQATGIADDTPSDQATDYIPSDEPEPTPEPECHDEINYCSEFYCGYDDIAQNYCRKFCGLC